MPKTTKQKQQAEKEQFALASMSAVSLFLGILTLLTGATYLVYRFFNDRAYREKWKDYEDCGLM